MVREKKTAPPHQARPGSAFAEPSRSVLKWATVIVTTLLLSITMVFQERFNLWLGSGITAVIALVFCFFSSDQGLFSKLAFSVRRLLLAIAGSLVLLPMTYLVYGLIVIQWPGLAVQVESLYQNLSSWPGLPAALPVLILVVWAEEMVWRGLLFELLQRWFSSWRLILICSLAYSLPHLIAGNLILLMVALLLGFFWTVQRYFHGNLLTPFLTHLIWDLFVMVFLPLSIVTN